MKIQILGTGCPKCASLTQNAQAAAQELGLDVEFEKVTSINDIMQFGCMSTPGLAIDGKLVSQGKVLKPDQVTKFLQPQQEQ